jgi:hypothetical protein
MMKIKAFILLTGALPLVSCADVEQHHSAGHELVSDQVIAEQRHQLAEHTDDKGFGPQAPRDIDSIMGNNGREFNPAPPYTSMNLCNIHFHKNAEHKGGEFTKYAGNGDGHGYLSGYKYSGHLAEEEVAPLDKEMPKRAWRSFSRRYH